MAPATFILIPLIITVFLLIRAEFANNRKMIHVVKPISILLVIVAALLSFGQESVDVSYTAGIVAGLVLCMVGDIMLMFPDNKRAFLIGLIFFLLGHVAYTITFIAYTSFGSTDYISAGIILVIGLAFFIYLLPNLGSMKVPIIFYILVISVMVNRAIAAFDAEAFNETQATIIAAGAILFYISDVVLAANRYGKPMKYNRISLAFYFAGQYLIAISASYFV
jgi:uncharacterized membrane protein YhhN